MGSVATFDEEMAGTWIGGKALKGLLKFIDEHRRRGSPHEEGFEGFERGVRMRFSEAEREFIGVELERLVVTLPEVVINGVVHRRVVNGYGDYMTAAGPVRVLQHRYRAVGTNGESECPHLHCLSINLPIKAFQSGDTFGDTFARAFDDTLMRQSDTIFGILAICVYIHRFTYVQQHLSTSHKNAKSFSTNQGVERSNRSGRAINSKLNSQSSDGCFHMCVLVTAKWPKNRQLD